MDNIFNDYILMDKKTHEDYLFSNKLEYSKYYDARKLDYLILPKIPNTEELQTIEYNSCIQNNNLQQLQNWYIENRSGIPFIERLSYYMAREKLNIPLKKYEKNEIKKISKNLIVQEKNKTNYIKRMEKLEISKKKSKKKEEIQIDKKDKLKKIKKSIVLNF